MEYHRFSLVPAAPGTPAVEVRSLTVRFTSDRGTVTALRDINLIVRQGGFLTILGASGCGKSTLLRVIADLVTASHGEAKVLGISPAQARAERSIGFVFQDAALLPWRTVLQNVTLPLEIARLPAGACRDPRELLGLVGLSGWEESFPHELSGGMRQRVAIARALVINPKLLLMDEPFGALDEITRDRLNEELLRLWTSTGTTILFVTHSLYEAAFLGEQVLVLAAHPGQVRQMVHTGLAPSRQITIRETAPFTDLVARLRVLLEGTHGC